MVSKRFSSQDFRAIFVTVGYVPSLHRFRRAERAAPLCACVARVGLALLVGLSALVGRRALVGLLLLASFGVLFETRRVLGLVAFVHITPPSDLCRCDLSDRSVAEPNLP